MLINVVKIKWGNVNEAVPAFLTIIIMPMTYSIAYGAPANPQQHEEHIQGCVRERLHG